ncbi:DUF4251 domain-containing protein [Halpernia sp.]|uniref:DUF4251 domain-containing protein n=1 Tax=Halpernia sp. TaxID=2782209 RepID=UPI003A947EAB
MKNTIFLIFLAATISLNSCAKKIYTSANTLQQITNSDEFTFLAERANPSNMDVVNVMNSLPNGSSQKFLNLDYGYVITIKNNELNVDLPYFGRLYTPNYDQSKNNYNFTSKDFTLTKSQDKKGNWNYKIVTKDQPTNLTISLEIYSNGKAYANLNSSDRQSISYDGYVMKNKPDNK